jgi:hypothetical protein
MSSPQPDHQHRAPETEQLEEEQQDMERNALGPEEATAGTSRERIAIPEDGEAKDKNHDEGNGEGAEQSLKEQPKEQDNNKQKQPAIVPQHIDMEALRALERATEEQRRPFDLAEAVPPRSKFLGLIKVSTERAMQYSRALPGNFPLMTDDLPEELWPGARDAFRLLNRAVGSSSETQMARPVRDLLELGLKHVDLRDEIYLQVRKQLTMSPKPGLERRIWQVLVALATVFPPSKRMQADFLEKVMAPSEGRQDDVGTIARYAHKKLRRLCQTGPRGYLPLLPEIERALVAPFRPSCFGVTLQEIMDNADLVDDTGNYPKVLIFLSEAVLKLGGCSTEGIFRVPGDHAAVTDLKLRIDNGDYTLPSDVRDPAVPASLLKYWLRDLAEPLVPEDLYERAIVSSNNEEGAIAVLDELPKPNLLVAKYMIKFLQVIGDARNQPVTKMNITNLALVFAPNFLRCPSENPMAILVNSKLEQCFVRTLINYLE